MNPSLCFVETIDWSLITSNARGNVARDNKAVNECPTCAIGNKSGDSDIDLSNSNVQISLCPKSSNSRQPLCWNHQQFQKSLYK